MPILAVLLVAAQVGGAEPAPTPVGLPFPVCSGLVVAAPQLKVQPADATFSARSVLDLEFQARLRRDLQGDHTLQLKIFTPHGFLYQVMTVPFSGSKAPDPRPRRAGGTTRQAPETPVLRSVPDFPRPLPVQALVPVSVGGQRHFQLTTSRFPVAGTSITLGSLYGRWTVVPYLDGQSAPCGPSRPFVIRE